MPVSSLLLCEKPADTGGRQARENPLPFNFHLTKLYRARGRAALPGRRGALGAGGGAAARTELPADSSGSLEPRTAGMGSVVTGLTGRGDATCFTWGTGGGGCWVTEVGRAGTARAGTPAPLPPAG